MRNRLCSLGLPLLAATLSLAPAASAVTIDWVTVGDPGNAVDTPAFGDVAYVYRISRTEVTNDQYAEFLNAVAATDANALYNTNMGSGFGGITRNMEIYKPIIAAINGYAMSGGLELALACDLRFCSPNAVFALQDVRWGFHACDGGLVRLPWIVGLGHAMEMFLSGDQFDADYALRVGLVNRIIPLDTLLTETLSAAEQMASRSPLAQRLGKEVMLRSLGRTLEDGLRMESRSFYDLGQSEDLEEGTTAFREKREPRFNRWLDKD